MARDVTLRATMSDLVGDETYELWLKHESDAWFIEDTGAVAVDGDSKQEFLLSSLTDGDDYVVQLRLKRAGRYRAGYLTVNPDTWPSSSRFAFTTGALEGVDPPVLNSAAWSRTSSIATKVHLSINASDLTKDLKVFRDGVAVHTIVGPHVNPVLYDDPNPTIATLHAYTAKHTVGFLDSAASNEIDVFAGPPAPTGFIMTSLSTQFGKYDVSWDNDGRAYRMEDDYHCADTFAAIIGESADTDGVAEVQKTPTLIPPGATQSAFFHARLRAEVTSFTVTDVSAWVLAAITMEINDPDDSVPDYNTCSP